MTKAQGLIVGMTEARILTIQWDSRTGMFDDSVLRDYLMDRELVRCVPQYFEYRGSPCWSVYLESRLVQGVEPKANLSGGGGERAQALAALVSEFDEIQQIRYDRLLQWRRETSRKQGIKAYMVCTNAQATELARVAPATMAALGSVHGFGDKKLKKYGQQILEILHGKSTGTDGGVRALDEDDTGFFHAVGDFSPQVSAQPDIEDGKPVSADDRTADDCSLQQEPGSPVSADGRLPESSPDVDSPES